MHLESLLGPGVQFAPFLWSGADAIRARPEHLQLAAQLHVDRERDPQARRLVIAHSHGGNVALRAIDLLGEPVPLATLATPFLSIRRRAVRDELDALVVGRSVARSIFVILLLVVTMVVAVLAEEATGFSRCGGCWCWRWCCRLGSGRPGGNGAGLASPAARAEHLC